MANKVVATEAAVFAAADALSAQRIEPTFVRPGGHSGGALGRPGAALITQRGAGAVFARAQVDPDHLDASVRRPRKRELRRPLKAA